MWWGGGGGGGGKEGWKYGGGEGELEGAIRRSKLVDGESMLN